jgi:hypothetical protein
MAAKCRKVGIREFHTELLGFRTLSIVWNVNN